MPSPRLALLAAALLVSLLTVTSHAEAGGPPGLSEPTAPDPAPRTRRIHYGYQTFLADVGWVAGSAALSRSDAGGGELVALGYYGGGPIVHLANHNRDAALKSLGLRVLLPIGGALAGMAIASNDEGEGDGFAVLYGMMLGFGAGAVTAMVIDWSVLSKRTIEERPAAPRALTLGGLRPGVKLGKRGVTLSLAGSF